eukprot:311431_1
MDGKVVPFKSYMVFQFNDPMKSTEISINGSDIKRVRSSRVCQCIFCIRRIIATYKEKEFSILPNGEDENCVFDALALRGTGPPGLYLYDKKNNTITAIQTVKDVAKYKENKISTIKSWAKATDTATNTTAEAIDVDINMMRTTIEPINGTKTIEDAHKQEQLSLNGAANAMNTVTSDNKESKDAKAHGNDLDAIDNDQLSHKPNLNQHNAVQKGTHASHASFMIETNEPLRLKTTTQIRSETLGHVVPFTTIKCGPFLGTDGYSCRTNHPSGVKHRQELKSERPHESRPQKDELRWSQTSDDNQVQNIFKKAFVKKKKIKRRILRSADESVNNNAQLSEAIDQIKVSDRFDVVTTHALGSKDKLEEDSINNAKNGDDENTQFHTENDIKWTKNAQISETIDETNGNVVIVSPTHDESPSLVSPYDETNEIEFETDRDTHNLANKSLTQHGHAALSASLLSHNPTRAIVRILKPVSNQQAECIESNDETNNAKVNDTEIESSVSNQQSDTQIEIESKAMNTIQMEEDSKSNDKASNCGMSSEATQQLNEMASIDLERLHCNNYVYNANVAAFKKPNDDMNLELDANSIDDTLTEWAFNTILIEFEQLYDDDHEDEPQLDAHNEDEPNVMHTMDMEEDEESSDESSSCLLDVELNAMHTMETKEDEDSSDESSSCELPPERECLLKQQTNEILRLQRINYVETSKRKHRHNKRKQLKELNKETVRHRLASISEIDTNQKDGEQTANIASEVADIAFDIDAVEEDKKKKRYAPILQDDEIDGREAKGLGSRVRSIQEHDQQQTKQQIIASITFGKEVTEEDKQYFISQLDKFDLWNVFSGHKWDVNTLDIPPFDIKIKDPSKNRLLPYYKLSEFDQTIASNEIKQWILRKIGRFATIQDEVHHASPGFVAHRRYAIEDDGMILVKSRIATDYILINDNTYEYNAGSIDTCAEVQNKIAQHLFINSTDATKYYYSIPITPAARAVSACSLKEGIFLFNVLPTGLKNASRYGAEITKRIFNDVGTATVMDDIYNGGVSVRKAIDNFIGLLQKANKSKVKLAAHKTIVGQREVECVGAIISAQGIKPVPRLCTKAFVVKQESIRSLKDVAIFSGMCHALVNFIVELGNDLARWKRAIIPIEKIERLKTMKLTPKQRRHKKSLIAIEWSDEATELFHYIKDKIRNTPLLHWIDDAEDAQTKIVKSDASDQGIAGTLWQERGPVFVLCKITSKSLGSIQQRWSTIEKECYALLTSLRKWKKHLIYQSFTAIGDHQPLQALFHLSKSVKNKKLLRWRIEICNYPLQFTYRRGTSTEMKMVDALSRITEPTDNPTHKEAGVVVNIDGLHCDEFRPEIGLFMLQEFQISNVDVEFESESISIDLEQLEIDLISMDANRCNKSNQMNHGYGAIDELQTIDMLEMANDAEEAKAFAQTIQVKQMDPSLSINRFMKACMGKQVWNKIEKHKRLKDDPLQSKQMNSMIASLQIQSEIPVSSAEYIQNLDHIQTFHDYLNRRKDLQSMKHHEMEETAEVMEEVVFSNTQPPNHDKWQWLKNDFDVLLENIDIEIDDNSESVLSTYELIQRMELITGEHKVTLNIDELMQIRNEYMQRIDTIDVNVTTRSQTALLKQSDQLIKDYLDKNDELITPVTDQMMQMMHTFQKKEYPHIRKMIAANGTAKRYIKWCTLFEIPYVSEGLQLVNGLLCKDSKPLVPTKIRIILLNQYHNIAMATHTSKEMMYKRMKREYWWKDMKMDIYAYAEACICQKTNIRRKGAMNHKDTGYNASYNVTCINQIVFYDLYGPTKHNNYGMVCGDLFDGCISCNAVKPVYSITAIGIINNLTFEWIFRKGLANSFVSDNGSNVSNQLNRVFCWMWMIEKKKIFTYTPWANGVAENKMKMLNRAIMIECTRRGLKGVDHIYAHMKQSMALSNFDFMIICRTIEVTHNDTPTKGTGYSPNMVRAAFMTPSLLDIRMGIAGITQLEQKDYIESGMVDFKKLIDTAMKINKTIVTQIKLNKINQNREQEMKNHIKALQKIKPSISIGDHVIYRGPPTVGKNGNDRIGYIVTDVISPKHPKDKNKKKHYMIKNVRTGAKFATNKGHLTRFARPRLLRALSSNNPMTRMMDLKHWRGNNLSELIEKESSK